MTEGRVQVPERISNISLLQEVIAACPFSTISRQEVVINGLELFLKYLIQHNWFPNEIDVFTIDAIIVETDQKLTNQVNEILHCEQFQKLESTWRSLKFVTDSIDLRENITVEILSVSKEELIFDFDDSPEIFKTGLYKIVYSNEYGVFGGKPYAVICADYEFGPGPQDIQLLSRFAAVAAMAHAPFIANASPELFGEESFNRLPYMRDLKSLF